MAQQFNRSDYIYAIVTVEAEQAMFRLQAMLESAWKRSKWQDTPTTHALLRGICALHERYNNYLELAKEDGHLLMCFHDSKIVSLPRTKGGAA